MNVFLRVINNLDADRGIILFNKIPFKERVIFVLNKYYSILFNLRKIRYLGRIFIYDMRSSPAILQFYPSEIIELNKYIPFCNMKTVLDIGANVGQWAFTAKTFFPNLLIYSFEPNKIPFLKLKENASCFGGWKIFNKGVGMKTQNRIMYYTDNSTVGGSFYKSVAGEFYKSSEINRTRVSIVRLDAAVIKEMKLPTSFDLVKIDVEGAELEVLRSLRHVDFKYLVIEVPIKSQRRVSNEKIEKIIKMDLGKEAKLLYVKPVGNGSYVADAVYQLI